VNTAYEKRRLEYDIGIGYGDDVELAKQVMLEAMRGAKDVISDPAPEVLVYEYGESTLNIRARWWIVPPRRSDALDSRDQVLSRIKSGLAAKGIDLPFPTRQILFHDQTEETDGDRSRQREGWPAGEGEVPERQSIASALARLESPQDREER
jgi:small conductance mechanosensitive channel